MATKGGGNLPDPLKVHTAKNKGGMGLPDPLGLFDSDPTAPTPPGPIDPRQQIIAQALALPSTYSPYGNAVYSGNPADGTFRNTLTLSPTEQALYEGRSGVALSMLDRAKGDPSLTTSYSFDGAMDPTTNRFFMAQKKLLDDAFDQDEGRLEQRLANQGLPMGSEAYDEEFENFRNTRADAMERAATNALTTGFQQDIAQRQQNYNEIAAALGGAQVTPVGSSGAPIDTNAAYANYQAGLNNQYAANLGQYNANIAQQNQSTAAAGQIGASLLMFL